MAHKSIVEGGAEKHGDFVPGQSTRMAMAGIGIGRLTEISACAASLIPTIGYLPT